MLHLAGEGSPDCTESAVVAHRPRRDRFSFSKIFQAFACLATIVATVVTVLQYFRPNTPPYMPIVAQPASPPPVHVVETSAPSEPAAIATFVADGWTAAGVYDAGVWTSRRLSFPAASKPEDLVGLVVMPRAYPGNYLRASAPDAAGEWGAEVGKIAVGDTIEIGDLRSAPSTKTKGFSVWVAVRRFPDR